MAKNLENLETQFLERKCCVLIPTYNNAQVLKQVLEEVIQVTHQVLVVNDGSTDGTAAILKEFPQIQVYSKPKNQGKGMALRDGFKKACELGYDYAITMDSDGQHFASDLAGFIRLLPQHQNALVIGARNMDQKGVPGKSSFGNKFSNFWFKVETGKDLPDTQSGYRLYPIRKLHHFFWITWKYEFEIEVIVRAAWAGIDVFCIPIKVYYPPQTERITHFRPFQDFSRISVLNTILVLITFLWIKPRDFFRNLFRKSWKQILIEMFADPNESDYVKAASVGLGLFMGIFPVWGLQLVIGLSLCQVLKLNKSLFVLFANISFPVNIPLIIWASHFFGGFFVPNPADFPLSADLKLDDIPKLGHQYLIGATALSFLAGILGFFLSFLFMMAKAKRK
jgi:glycosyltransferase involved in cell wall biosynthesis